MLRWGTRTPLGFAVRTWGGRKSWSRMFSDYPEGVTIVRDKLKARQVVSDLMELKHCIHACDTETPMIDDKQGIIGRDIPVICASIYAGGDFDFGSGPIVWIGMCIR